ncbi:MAG: hypothetical protein HYZ27_10465, partial [Deltaproteobacteria bacterium]|nr:hypothetical protein [Deltaproteobacteria bacterium]
MKRAALVLAAWACVPGDLAPVRLELLVRGSCPPSTATYDISCVQALTVGLVGADDTRFRTDCTVLAGQYATLVDLIASQQLTTVLEHIRARNDVRLELRAYKGADGEPCSDLDDSNLMFWGSSELVDLSDESLTEVIVSIECRPDCDCADLADPVRCPAELPVGACARAANLTCRRSCNPVDGACYGGAAQCSTNVCDGDPDTTCCGNPPNGLCMSCTTSADCA